MTLDNINRAAVDRIIRVDHAGEYGANRIYAGQMAVLGRSSVGPVIQVGSLSLSLVCCTGSVSEACSCPFWLCVPKGGAWEQSPCVFYLCKSTDKLNTGACL